MGASSIAWRTSVDYMKRSSIAGLSHAANSRSYVRSLYWLLVFVVGLALTVRSLANLVEEFLDYPVVTSSHLTTKPSVAFPAVTICNINRVNCVNLEEEALNLHKEGRLNESVKMVQFSIDIGCRAQVCNSVGITISGRREGPWLDSRAFAMGELGCKVHLEDKKLVNQMCYYYHTVKEYDEDVTAEAKAMAQKVTFLKKEIKPKMYVYVYCITLPLFPVLGRGWLRVRGDLCLLQRRDRSGGRGGAGGGGDDRGGVLPDVQRKRGGRGRHDHDHDHGGASNIGKEEEEEGKEINIIIKQSINGTRGYSSW